MATEVFDLMSLQPNIPSIEFGTYATVLSGPPKLGKSEFITYFDKPLIFDFEEGTKGKVVFRVPISKWTEVKKYVKQLIKEPALKERYQTIAFDTVNYALEACKQYIMDQYQADHADKVIDTFNKIPYGGGHELLSKEWKSTINSLKRAGYGIVMVTHVKEKIFEKETSNEHTKTVPDLSDRERNMISAMADFLLLGEFETNVIRPAKMKDNKVVEEAVVETKRVLYLRTDENAEAGFRWKNCPEKIPFDFNVFKEVFSKAVMQEIEEGTKRFNLSEDDIKKISDTLEERRIKEQEEVFEKEKEESIKQEEIDKLVNEIKEIATRRNKEEGISGKAINKILKKINLDTLDNLEEGQKVIDEINALTKEPEDK